jgi:transposase
VIKIQQPLSSFKDIAMIQLEFTAEDIEALRYWRFHHPEPRVQVRLEALFLRSQGLPNADIQRLCGISKASFHRFLDLYGSGGLEKLKALDHYRPQSELMAHRASVEASFREHPPATIKEAAAKIEELTGIARKPTQVRQFLQALGLKPRKVGMLPAKAAASPAALAEFQRTQETFKKNNWSRA